MTNPVSVDALLIVGCHVDDVDTADPRPFVVGAIDLGTLDVIGMDEEEQWINGLKNKYGGINEYVFREVKVKLDREALADLFKRPTVEAILETKEEGHE